MDLLPLVYPVNDLRVSYLIFAVIALEARASSPRAHGVNCPLQCLGFTHTPRCELPSPVFYQLAHHVVMRALLQSPAQQAARLLGAALDPYYRLVRGG